MGSRGCVIPFFLKNRPTGVLPITDPRMTRFNISLQDAVEMVLWSLEHLRGGEILVPKIPSYRILDVAKAIGPECTYPTIGIRPGEKIHEEMITESDSFNTIDLGKYYAILPVSAEHAINHYCKTMKTHPVTHGFSYNSGNNDSFLSVEELRVLIKQHVTRGSDRRAQRR